MGLAGEAWATPQSGLLPHLEEAVDSILCIAVVSQPVARSRVLCGLLIRTVG